MFSADAFLHHLSFALLVAAVLVAKLTVLRALIAGAAVAEGVRAWFWTNDMTALGWSAALVLICLFLIAKGIVGRRHVELSAEDKALLDSLVAGLSKTRARHLIEQGMWLSGKAGDVLTREGEPVERLCYLAEGDAKVESMGRQVGTCHAGDLVGELSVLSGDPASATVTLTGPARFWCAPSANLRPYVEANEDIRRAIEHGFATALKAKLRASNRALADAGRGAA